MRTTKEITSTFSCDQLLEEATMAIRNQQYYDALHMLNTVLLYDRANISVRLKKGLCYLYLNQARKAAFLFDQILSEDAFNAEALACYAEFFKVNMDYETAATYISAAMAADEENATYQWQAAEISYLKRDLESAYTLINRAIVLSPFRAEFYYWRALILKSFKRIQVALHDLNRALALFPQYTDALRLRAKIKMYTGTFDDAVKDLKLVRHFETIQEKSYKRVV